MIFIKPTVLRTTSDGRELTSERYEYLRGEQERQTPAARLFWSDPSQPTLPPEGVMPGVPRADPTPPLLGDKFPLPKEPSEEPVPWPDPQK